MEIRNFNANSQKKWLFLSLGILVAVMWYLLGPLWKPGYPVLVDTEYHLARIANFHLAFLQGQLPVRWGPTLLSGLGSPVFNYNYPLFNYLAIPLLSTGLSVVASLKLIVAGFYVLGGLGMWVWMRRKYGVWPATLAAVTYVASPFPMVDVFSRATIGETVAMGLWPWLFYGLERTGDKPSVANKIWLAVSWGAVLLAHNIMAGLIVGVMVWWMITTWSLGKVWRVWQPILIGVMISSFFWIPALSELDLVGVASSQINREGHYERFFMSWRELVHIPGLQEERAEAAVDVQLGWGLLVVVVVVSAWLVVSWDKLVGAIRKRLEGKKLDEKDKIWMWVFCWLAVMLGSVYMTQEISTWLWELLPGIRYVQHPTRMLALSTLSGAVLVAVLVGKLRRSWFEMGLVLVLVMQMLTYGEPEVYFPYADSALYDYALSTAAVEEFNPNWYDAVKSVEVIEEKGEHLKIVGGQALVEEEYWDGSKRKFRITSQESVTVVERTLYFPGWETKIDGRVVDNGGADKEKFAGLIHYSVPAGEHVVETRFTDNTWPRLLGDGLSVVGWGVVGWWVIKLVAGRKKI